MKEQHHHHSRGGGAAGVWGMLLCMLLLSPISTTAAANGSEQEMEMVQVVKGYNVNLTCDVPRVPPEDPADELYRVFWFKDNSTKFFYVKNMIDNREIATAELGPRVEFLEEENMLYLRLLDVTAQDTGTYHCTAQYFQVMDKERYTSLTVIVPPGMPTILQENGTQVDRVLGPYDEGTNITVTCRVVGGWPRPQVTWWKGSEILRGQVTSGDGEIRNLLHLGPLTRGMLLSQYSCQSAVNNQLIPHDIKAVTLDINLKPDSVEVVHPKSALVAGQENVVTCRSTGSRPPAVITWFVGGQPLDNQSVTHQHQQHSEETVSRLALIPTMEDSGKLLICRARSPVINHEPIVDTWKLNVQYAPVVTLRRQPAEPTEVKEGDTITFVCEVSANPKANITTFFHKSLKIKSDKNRTVLQNRLKIRYVRRHDNGIYTCRAANQHGDATSTPLMLDVMYKPVCSNRNMVPSGAALQDTVSLECNMNASPGSVSFEWYANHTGSLIPLPSEDYTTQDRISVLRYQVRSNEDYGKIVCYARNKLGNTTRPCLYKVIPAGKPQMPDNCTVTSQTTDTLFANCLPGYNGGLDQHFVVQVFEFLDSNNKKILLRNITEPDDPTFVVGGLSPATAHLLSIFAENKKGRSQESQIHGFTLTAGPGSKSSIHIFPITPILGVLIGVVGALVLVAIIVVVVMKLRGDARRDQMRQGPGGDGKLGPPHTPLNNPTKDDCGTYEDMDGIPQKLKHVNIYETVPYDTDVAGKKSEGSDGDEVEYAELTFSNGKNKQKGGKKAAGTNSSGANGTIRAADDNTIYATIDHTRSVPHQNQRQGNNNNKKQQPAVVGNQEALMREPDEIPLMDAPLESSV